MKVFKGISGSPMKRKRALWGLLFILPWLIGAVYFFLIPMIKSAAYAFCRVELTADGDKLTPAGFSNFLYMFTEDPDFITNLSSSVLSMLYQVPVIVLFSLFIALMLREKFFGRTMVRAIFFFPVIIASGVVITILKEQVMMSATSTSEEQQAYMFAAPSFTYFIEQMGIPEAISNLAEKVISGFFDILWKSGVQIILFLAAVNHISASSYEAADIEGASAWEKLWKITFPMISPTILVVLIYSIIDSFTDYGNLIMRSINSYFSLGQYAYSATLGIVYFLVVLFMVGLVNFFIGRKIQYTVD